MAVRSGLQALCLRCWLRQKEISGKPDPCLPRYRAANFSHGCFWCGHDCSLTKMPAPCRISRKSKSPRIGQEMYVSVFCAPRLVYVVRRSGNARFGHRGALDRKRPGGGWLRGSAEQRSGARCGGRGR
ncbi:hypothetical protein [Rhodobacter sp. 24-YEA-8]|uniref:hypothetical protein n=1 Tax=Rhodobacter sp. 24-YEA-8 TaxID=1884310 RepID=UPI00344B40D8